MMPKERHMYLPRSLRVFFALTLREMATTYGRSYFGYLWAILDPIGAIAILSIAFSFAFKAPALGDSFPLFYATGYVPFLVYNSMQQKINSVIRQNKALLFYPRVTYIDAIITRFVLNFMTQLLVAIIVFVGIFVLFDISSPIDVGSLFGAIAVASVLGLGIGTLNCVIVHLAPGWKQIWGILTRPLFLLSCIFYLFDSLPIWVQSILWFNPLIHIVGLTRSGIYTGYRAEYVHIAYPLCIGGLSLLLGLLLLRRYAADMVND